MIDFPERARVHRRLPKEAFYKHLSVPAALKDSFVSDIESVFAEWSLTEDSLNLDRDSRIKEILIIVIELRKQDFDAKILEAIARQNPHRLVFILKYDGRKQLALYYRQKLYRSPWEPDENVALSAKGFSLDEIWDGMIEQIALLHEPESGGKLSVDERLTRQEEINRLQRQIEKTEAAAWGEIQPKKRFELYSLMEQYRKQLEKIKNEYE